MKTILPCFSLLRLGKNYHLTFFLICCLKLTGITNAQTVTTGKSYVNITRPNGGTFLPGDIIEVRATIAVTGGNNSSSANRVNFVRYNDTINLAKFEYITGTLCMLSNEGRLQQSYQDGPASVDSDSAHIDYTTGQLRFNIGNNSGGADVNLQGTGTTNAGRLWGSNFMKPSFYGGTCIRVYAYRLRIRTTPADVAVDSVISLSAGNFRYRVGNNTTDILSNFPVYRIRIAPDLGLCNNATGSNAILGESGGTFGSGATQNQAGGTTFVPPPYSFRNFASGNPNDNYYGLANRTSADGSTNGNVAYPNSSRVFTVWDIIGDHTGAADPYLGNPPTNNGYAVIINASYETNRAFTQTINNVCEETYYEFSAWFRNICRRCGCDSSGKGAMQTGYVPAPGDDSSGVKPNLTFQVDGLDVYTTGNLAYSGQWVKKGFLFRTRAGQNSFTVTIRNNAPGGGGNDWAIDDITVATCLPDMQYSPSLTPTICMASPLRLEDTVRSYFNNYTYYKWQRSTDNGSTWTDITSNIGPVSPYWNSSAGVWEYVAVHTVPAALTGLSNSGDRYRVVTGTSPGNLSDPNCLYTETTNTIALNVLDCHDPLIVHLTSFTGKHTGNVNRLNWTTANESKPLKFDIERRDGNGRFETIATVSSDHAANGNNRSYQYDDVVHVNGSWQYRIRVYDTQENIYSRILQLHSRGLVNELVEVINPFGNEINFDISLTTHGRVRLELIDFQGHLVKTETLDLAEGINQVRWDGMQQVRAGVYVLRAITASTVLYRKMLKGKN